MQASISSGCRNDIALHGGWDIHSSALGLQTQHNPNSICHLTSPFAYKVIQVLGTTKAHLGKCVVLLTKEGLIALLRV
jgi:hypothetical protein